MANKTVVRNAAYTRGSVSIRERHNERKNECYSNADIRLERSSTPSNFMKTKLEHMKTFQSMILTPLILLLAEPELTTAVIK